MKKSRTLKIICACLISFVSLSGVCNAETMVRYEATEDEIVATEVKVVISAKSSEFGSIYDGNLELDIGEAIYQLKYGETKSFRIRPALGYDVYRVMYDGEDITSQLKQGRARSIQKEYTLVIAGRGHNCELDVSYKKLGSDEPIIPEEPVKPEDPTTPEEPVKPEDPTTPEEPDKPEDPTTPEEPDKPENPTTPETPGDTEKPSEPNKPGEPSKPGNSTSGDKPKIPENINKPVSSGSVVIPTYPDGAGNNGTGNNGNNAGYNAGNNTGNNTETGNNIGSGMNDSSIKTTTENESGMSLPTIRNIDNIYFGALIVFVVGFVIIILLKKKRKEE